MTTYIDSTVAAPIYRTQGDSVMVVTANGLVEIAGTLQVDAAGVQNLSGTLNALNGGAINVQSGATLNVNNGGAANVASGGTLALASGSLVGLFGVTPVAQPSSANEAAVGNVPTSFTWNGSSVYPSAADATAIVNAFAAIKTLVNQLRADLVTLGVIKGSA
jgi:hypothetical protein